MVAKLEGVQTNRLLVVVDGCRIGKCDLDHKHMVVSGKMINYDVDELKQALVEWEISNGVDGEESEQRFNDVTVDMEITYTIECSMFGDNGWYQLASRDIECLPENLKERTEEEMRLLSEQYGNVLVLLNSIENYDGNEIDTDNEQWEDLVNVGVKDND